MSFILPDVAFDDVPLNDVVDFLREIVPEFKTMVVRERGVPENFPSVRVKLKHVSMGQLWELLQRAYPELEVEPVAGDPTPIYLIRVKAPSADSPSAAAAPPVVRVYRLSPLLAPVAGKPAGPVNAPLDNVLSLIKATLAQAPGHGEVVLQVHPETQTLIFKGTLEQKTALEEALAALEPEASPQRARLAQLEQQEAQMRETFERDAKQSAARASELEGELSAMKTRLADQEKEILSRTIDAEKTKARLEEQTDVLQRLKELQNRNGIDARPARPTPAQP
jgi:hypothetical protein